MIHLSCYRLPSWFTQNLTLDFGENVNVWGQMVEKNLDSMKHFGCEFGKKRTPNLLNSHI